LEKGELKEDGLSAIREESSNPPSSYLRHLLSKGGLILVALAGKRFKKKTFSSF